MENTIKKWISCLIEKKPLPLDLVSKDFNLEDGMNLEEYWIYEKNSFDEYSKIFDLDHNFRIYVFHKEKIRKNIYLVWFYVINKKNKITFKMSITINESNLIASNNFYTQFVAKYKIENSKITSLGLAIKSKFPIDKIISDELSLQHFSLGASFEEDGFYSANFFNDNIELNKKYSFFVKFKNQAKIEKRVIFFDNVRLEDKPFIIDKDNIFINNEVYPVGIALFYKDGTSKKFPYPRDLKFRLENLKKIIITDVLDNDWIIKV